MTSFRILGPVEAGVGEDRLSIGGRRQLKLLAALLVNANRAVSTDALVDVVWGPERSGADNRLQMAIARLRKALEPLNGDDGPRVRTVAGGYMLMVATGELDADVFQARVQDGREALAAGEADRASELLTSALRLWRGPPLADVAFEDFAQPEIRRLEELRLEALEARIDAELRLGHHAQTLGELGRLLAEHPSRERLASQLMLALYRSGRQGDALDVYQRTRGHLLEELGIEPGPALKAMQAQILQQADSLDRSRGDVLGLSVPDVPRPTSPPSLPTPTIGRQQEIASIRGLLTRDEVRLVTAIGTGGVGKTRVALEVARSLEPVFPDGVCWVELAGTATPEDVAPSIVRALALTPLPQVRTAAKRSGGFWRASISS